MKKSLIDSIMATLLIGDTMTRLSKIARKRHAAGARRGKARQGVIEARVEKLCKIVGDEKAIPHWTKLVQNDWKAVRKLQNAARAKTRAAKKTVGKPVTVKIGDFTPAAKNAFAAEFANNRFFRNHT